MSESQGFTLHPLAAQDITDIWEFIAEHNPLAARRVREDILDAIGALVPFPIKASSGLTSPPAPYDSRSWVTTLLRTRRMNALCW
jgi:plasmid stabilization system protein ParE